MSLRIHAVYWGDYRLLIQPIRQYRWFNSSSSGYIAHTLQGNIAGLTPAREDILHTTHAHTQPECPSMGFRHPLLGLEMILQILDEQQLIRVMLGLFFLFFFILLYIRIIYFWLYIMIIYNKYKHLSAHLKKNFKVFLFFFSALFL